MDDFRFSPEDAVLLREMASTEEMPYGTDASALFEKLKNHIINFEKSLDTEHEVGIMLTHFGQSVLMQVTELSYEQPTLIEFKGYINKKMSVLVQHVSQLNFLLTSVPKEPDRPKLKIGFATE